VRSYRITSKLPVSNESIRDTSRSAFLSSRASFGLSSLPNVSLPKRGSIFPIACDSSGLHAG